MEEMPRGRTTEAQTPITCPPPQEPGAKEPGAKELGTAATLEDANMHWTDYMIATSYKLLFPYFMFIALATAASEFHYVPPT